MKCPLPPRAGAFAGGEVMGSLAAHQCGGEFFIEASRDHAHAPGAHFFRFLAGGENLRLEEKLAEVAHFDFLYFFHLLVGDIQGVADMGMGVGTVALLLRDARDIGFVEPLQPRQAVPVEADTDQHKNTGPKNIYHQDTKAWMP